MNKAIEPYSLCLCLFRSPESRSNTCAFLPTELPIDLLNKPRESNHASAQKFQMRFVRTGFLPGQRLTFLVMAFSTPTEAAKEFGFFNFAVKRAIESAHIPGNT
jgi:hypothetical protein